MSILEVSHIRKNFGSTEVLTDISFTMDEGQAVSIIGSSGSGKTTLLRCLNFLETPDEGTIRVRDEILFDGAKKENPSEGELRRRRLHFGLVFQQFNLFPQYTALENVCLAPKLALKEKNAEELQKITETGEELLERMGLKDRMENYPHQLSGGQQQRVAIARALAMDTEILLMDEPFGALDPRTRVSLQKLLLSLWRSEEGEKKTVVFVTHDVDEAIYLSDRIIVMQPNPGRIYREVHVPFPRPRDYDALIGTKEYQQFRSELVELFYRSDLAEEAVG